MEILDPNTRSCTFLVLTTYAGEKDKVIPATCSLKKDEAFLDSTNCFVAAESWRLSCAPNPNGIVYHWIPKEYYITVTMDTGSHAQGETDVDTVDLSDSMKFINILQDEVALPDKQQFTVAPIEPDDIKENLVDIY